MNVIVCGYGWAGCRAVEMLKHAGHRLFVFTHEAPWYLPDLATYCDRSGVGHSIKDISSSELPFTPDVIASVHYRYIIKPWVISATGRKVFNLHPSLLPAYRGCSSLTWAMINGENETGYTYHLVDEHCDTGNILIQHRVPVSDYDTQSTLYHQVMVLAMGVFAEAFDMCARGVVGSPQSGQSSYYLRGCPFGGNIDPSWDEAKTERFIRAMVFPPLPCARCHGKEVRTFQEFLNMRDHGREDEK